MMTLAEFFGLDVEVMEYEPSYNVAPTQPVLTVTLDDNVRSGHFMKWGLIPSWAKDASIGSRMINARAETVAERPSFRAAFRRRRCLVLADGFFEWKRVGNRRIPMRISLKSHEPFAFAGLWETWRNPKGDTVLSCTIITTRANDDISEIHDRMPVILPRGADEPWLDPEAPLEIVSGLLTPYEDGQLEAVEVSTLVNSPRNNVPETLAPVNPLL
jgi:putative SOS response-associated peptidase YedK